MRRMACPTKPWRSRVGRVPCFLASRPVPSGASGARNLSTLCVVEYWALARPLLITDPCNRLKQQTMPPGAETYRPRRPPVAHPPRGASFRPGEPARLGSRTTRGKGRGRCRRIEIRGRVTCVRNQWGCTRGSLNLLRRAAGGGSCGAWHVTTPRTTAGQRIVAAGIGRTRINVRRRVRGNSRTNRGEGGEG